MMADLGLRISDFGFWFSDCRFKDSRKDAMTQRDAKYFGFQISDFGFKDSRKDAMTQRDAKFFWILDFGSRISDLKTHARTR